MACSKLSGRNTDRIPADSHHSGKIPVTVVSQGGIELNSTNTPEMNIKARKGRLKLVGAATDVLKEVEQVVGKAFGRGSDDVSALDGDQAGGGGDQCPGHDCRDRGRAFVKFLPWQLGHTAVFNLVDGSTAPGFLVLSIGSQVIVVLSMLAVALDTEHRAIHDWITHSHVVAAPSGGRGARGIDPDITIGVPPIG